MCVCVCVRACVRVCVSVCVWPGGTRVSAGARPLVLYVQSRSDNYALLSIQSFRRPGITALVDWA